MTTSHESQHDIPNPDIVVVGAGIAGLVAALTAAESGASVVLLDAQTPGGRARTTDRDGYHYNVGPHALYLAGHLRPFLASRNMDPAGGMPDTKHVRLLRDGRLWPITFNALDIARTKLLSPRSRVRTLSLMARIPKMDVEQFVGTTWRDWLGNEPDDVAGLLEMFVRTGTYVNAPDDFDAGAALIQFQAALRGVRYIDGGWRTIVDGLVARIRACGGRVSSGRTVLSVEVDGDALVTTAEGTVRAGAVVLAGLSPDAVERITAASIAGRGDAGAAVHASVLDIALDRAHPGLVFGIDEPLYLSPHGPTARVNPDGAGLVTVMRYTPDAEVDGPTATQVRERLTTFATRAGIAPERIVHERYLHRLVVANSFPAASGGGLRGRPGVAALGVPDVFLAGDWVGSTHQLADAASASGEAAALRAVAHATRGSRVRA